MNGSVFKRKLRSGATVWCYSFYAGRDDNGKPINLMKGGFETKGAAATAKRDAITDYERTHGKITHYRGALGTVTWGYILADETKNGFPEAADARAALADAIRRRAAAEQVAAAATIQAANTEDRTNPKYADFVKYWLENHAARNTSPKTYERYTDFARYLNRYIGQTRINGLSTAQIQDMIHRLEDSGGKVTKDHPDGRPLAPKTVRHIGTMLYTSLAEAYRLGILTVRHPMANKRVRLPKLPKRKPSVVVKEKFKALLDRAATTRYHAFIATATGSG